MQGGRSARGTHTWPAVWWGVKVCTGPAANPPVSMLGSCTGQGLGWAAIRGPTRWVLDWRGWRGRGAGAWSGALGLSQRCAGLQGVEQALRMRGRASRPPRPGACAHGLCPGMPEKRELAGPALPLSRRPEGGGVSQGKGVTMVKYAKAADNESKCAKVNMGRGGRQGPACSLQPALQRCMRGCAAVGQAAELGAPGG